MLRPIDMNTMLPRLGEVSRVQQHTESQPQIAQHIATMQSTERNSRAQQQVVQRDPSEKAAIRRDGGRGGRPDEDSTQRKKKAKKVVETPTRTTIRPNHLDVKL